MKLTVHGAHDFDMDDVETFEFIGPETLQIFGRKGITVVRNFDAVFTEFTDEEIENMQEAAAKARAKQEEADRLESAVERLKI